MRVAILDACFPEDKQHSRGMGAKYLAWKLQQHGIKEDKPCDSDIVLISCVSTSSAKYLKRIRNKYPQKTIICGGAASTSPHTLGQYCDAVCVGDGGVFLDTLFTRGIEAALNLDNVWINGQDRTVTVDNDFPWDMPPMKCEDGAVRVWCGRGCKNKCAFCQTGWAYDYKENPNPQKLVSQVRALLAQGQKVNYLSNDLAQHSFFRQLPDVQHGSYSVKYLKKYGLPHARQIRLGIEGVSERLRTLVKKPISTKDLLGSTIWLNNNGRSVRWFLIAGLPSETEQDWQELKHVILEWKKRTQKGVLGLSFTAWCPDPATPMAPMPMRDEYWGYFVDFREWFFGGLGWSNRIKLMQPQQPKARLEKAMYSMGLTKEQLRRGGYWGPNDRVAYPHKQAAKAVYQTMAKEYMLTSR